MGEEWEEGWRVKKPVQNTGAQQSWSGFSNRAAHATGSWSTQEEGGGQGERKGRGGRGKGGGMGRDKTSSKNTGPSKAGAEK